MGVRNEDSAAASEHLLAFINLRKQARVQ